MDAALLLVYTLAMKTNYLGGDRGYSRSGSGRESGSSGMSGMSGMSGGSGRGGPGGPPPGYGGYGGGRGGGMGYPPDYPPYGPGGMYPGYPGYPMVPPVCHFDVDMLIDCRATCRLMVTTNGAEEREVKKATEATEATEATGAIEAIGAIGATGVIEVTEAIEAVTETKIEERKIAKIKKAVAIVTEMTKKSLAVVIEAVAMIKTGIEVQSETGKETEKKIVKEAVAVPQKDLRPRMKNLIVAEKQTKRSYSSV